MQDFLKKIKIPFLSYYLLLPFLLHEFLANSPTKSLRISKLTNLRKIDTKNFCNIWKLCATIPIFHQIFTKGIEIILFLGHSRKIDEILIEIKNIALEIYNSPYIAEFDMLGQLYHQFLIQTDQNFYAPFYTSPPAAHLLARFLTSSLSECPKTHLELNSNSETSLKVLDPACGSGTLLSAIYFALREKYQTIYSNLDTSQIHKEIVEETLWGFDVMDSACDLAKVSLNLFNTSILCNNTHIYSLLNGIYDKKIHLGSLDTLSLSNHSAVYTKEMNGKISLIPIQPESFDIILMNPPFSRSANPNTKFGYETKKNQDIMRKELNNLLKSNNLIGIGQAGLSAPFVFLGCKFLKPDGKLGLIIPRSFLSGVSWIKIRNILYNEFEIEYIISNFDIGDPLLDQEGWNWSYNTDLGEVMIIARKIPKLHIPISQRKSLFLNLVQKPTTSTESQELEQAVTKARQRLEKQDFLPAWSKISCRSKFMGWLYQVPQTLLSLNFHFPCVFAHPEINQMIISLSQFFRNSSSNLPLGDLVERHGKYLACGRDIKQIKTNFSPTTQDTIFHWVRGHQGSMNKLSLDEKYLQNCALKSGDRSEKIYRTSASNLLISTRPHINSECILACKTPKKCVATAFWEIRLKPEYLDFQTLLLLWFNSTYGFLLLLAYSVNSKAQIFKFKKNCLRKFPIPFNFSNKELKEAHTLWIKLRDIPLSPFSDQIQNASMKSGVRFEIDQFIQRILKARSRQDFCLSPLYPLISHEPSLTLNKYSWQSTRD